MTSLSQWQPFCEIVGSSAGALIGLQFVVMTLIANLPEMQPVSSGGEAFLTPTVLHFSLVVLLAAITAAPWHTIVPAAWLWGLAGFSGVLYVVEIARRMRRHTRYKPEFEDWLFHVILPWIAYGILLGAALLATHFQSQVPCAVAASLLMLLFIGIHNAWDIVTYHIFVRRQEQQTKN
jgi:surface polysaccharide O-acyltransferase-like enzyme